MALWGSQRISTLSFSFASVLPSILTVTSLQHEVVDLEVLLSLNRLTKVNEPQEKRKKKRKKERKKKKRKTKYNK